MQRHLFPKLALVLITGLASVGFFFFLYHYDNKYITRATVSQDGITLLQTNGSANDSAKWLVEAWEFYPDQLLEPGDDPNSSVSVYIGQYFSWSAFHTDGSPYGTGTYRLHIYGHGDYSLYLPEIFCACRIYVNDKLVSSSGSLKPYNPLVQDLILPVTLDGEAVILIQTANYDHYYSGITYPPAIGSAKAVNTLLISRMLYYSFLCFTCLALALFASSIWFGLRKSKASPENLWLGTLALTFAVRVCYPFFHMYAFPFWPLSYLLEDSMAAVGFLCIFRTISLLCLKPGGWTDRIITGTGAGFIAVTFAANLVLLDLLPGFAPLYGQIIYWYKFLSAVLLLLLLSLHFLHNRQSGPILLAAGLIIYSVSLAAHALCLGRYEPARFGWFEEWGTYALILLFAARLAARNMQIIRENRHLNQHLQDEVARKTRSLSNLLEERRLVLSAFAHDLKTPVTSITTFTRLVELNNTGLDKESIQYLETIRQKTKDMKTQLEYLSELNQLDSSVSQTQSVDLCELVSSFYHQNYPDFAASGILLTLSLSARDSICVNGNPQKLTSVLQNLIYNSLSFTPKDGTIRITLSQESDMAVLQVADNGTGITPEDLPHIFDRHFTRRKDGSGQGLGLYITKCIVTSYGGTINVESDQKTGSVFTVTLPVE